MSFCERLRWFRWLISTWMAHPWMALMEPWYRPRSCESTPAKEREERREELTRNFDRAFLTLRESSLSEAPEGPGAPVDNANRSDSKTVDQKSLFPRSWSESFFRPRAAPQTIDGEKQTVEQAKFPPIKLSSLEKSGRAFVSYRLCFSRNAPTVEQGG